MLRRLLSFLALSSLLFVASTSSCHQECKDLPFTPEVRNYFLDFKEGSYWIYRNTANGDLDSVYFVSQDTFKEGVGKGGPVCSQEYSVVKLNGFAGKLFVYAVKSWDSEMEISSYSEIAFAGDYDTHKLEDKAFAGFSYNNVIILNNCCVNGCNNACNAKYFRFMKLYFAPQVGLVRWEAENHPQYGNAAYDLIRYKAIR